MPFWQEREGSIIIVTDEDLSFYYRLRLNEYISGEIMESDLRARDEKLSKERRENSG